MRYAATKEIFSCWDRLRGARRAPDRHELSPAGFGRNLPDLFLLERDEAGDFRFRIAGSRLCGVFGKELRGTSFLDVIGHASADDARDMLSAVTDDMLPVVSGLSVLQADRIGAEAEMLLLPLVHGESTDSRILGAFSPRMLDRQPTLPCAGLDILSFRVLTDVDVHYFHAARPEPAETPQKDRRAHLRVVEGGRA